ncbi:hypothetical protein AVEN_267107-1 [Araneus ventricosus]|uniref:Uncharacterized protein n=1 Tax=Araneus ventricosus TaxID=182803 RepID=A0A4Y2VXZ2_ARAVE|nr:hypothetical protein AVEN_267107-1 [Araneus ventricosus]
MLTSRFEATRGLFWGESRNLEPQSDDDNETSVVPPPPNSRITPAEGRLATMYGLACNRHHSLLVFGGIRFRTWSPLAPKPRLDH